MCRVVRVRSVERRLSTRVVLSAEGDEYGDAVRVSATASAGLDHTEVCRDVWKLSMLLDEAERRDVERPLAYVCILDNNARRRYNLDYLGG